MTPLRIRFRGRLNVGEPTLIIAGDLSLLPVHSRAGSMDHRPDETIRRRARSMTVATRKRADDAHEPQAAPSAGSETPTSEAGWKAPSRRGRTTITAFVDVPTHQQFRILSVEQRRSGQQLLIEAVNDLFRKYGKEPIAQ